MQGEGGRRQTVDRAHAGRQTDRIVIPAKYLRKLSFVAVQVLHS